MYNNHVVTTSFSYSTVIHVLYSRSDLTVSGCNVPSDKTCQFTVFLIIFNNNDYSLKKLLYFQIIYLQPYFNLLDTHIAQCYYHLFLILNLYNIFLVMLNYYITVRLLYNYLIFFGIVICSERNVLMSISPLQFSLMYNSSYHHWLTSIIHFISGMHFISRRHHINKYDVTNHTRSFYPMDHSLTDPLTTNYFFQT